MDKVVMKSEQATDCSARENDVLAPVIRRVSILLLIVVSLFAAPLTSLAADTTVMSSESATDEVNHQHHQAIGSLDTKKQTSEVLKSKPESLTEYVDQQLAKAEGKVAAGLNKNTSSSDSDEDELSVAAAAMGENTREQALKLQSNLALTGEYNEAYYPLEALNAGLPELDKPVNLLTPLATLEFFQTAIMQKKFALASYALNMNLLEKDQQVASAIDLVKKLDFLLTEKKLYLFEDLPDRADGLIEPPLGSGSSIEGIPRRSIKLGYIDYNSRRVPIFLERVRVGEAAPIWVFSAQTVENIEMLYEQHKPAEFAKYLPNWLTARFFGIAIWEYLALVLFVSLTLGLGWLISRATAMLVNWYTDSDNTENPKYTKKDSLPDLINKLLVPLTFTISFTLVFALVSGAFPYIDAIASSTRPIVWVGLVIVTLWLGIRTINFFANRYQDFQIESLSDEEFHKERRRRTYVSIFRRIFIFVMILGGFWIGLSEFANLEGLGKTLLTSAGIAGAVIGIAAQPILGNIIAGMLVAVTQPVRIGDTVIINDIWSTIEDLRYTYAVVLTWDERRLIVPMRYFVTEILENWSHTDAHQASAVYLYVDYGADIEEIRQKFVDVVKANELWDGESEPAMLVSSVNENTITLRGKVAASNPADAWSLECEVREAMLNYLNEEQKAYLPTERFTLKGSEAGHDGQNKPKAKRGGIIERITNGNL